MEYDDNGQKARLDSSIASRLREKITNRLVCEKVKNNMPVRKEAIDFWNGRKK